MTTEGRTWGGWETRRACEKVVDCEGPRTNEESAHHAANREATAKKEAHGEGQCSLHERQALVDETEQHTEDNECDTERASQT